MIVKSPETLYMRNLLLLVGFCCCVFLIGCKKDSLATLKSKLEGSWELRDIQGGFVNGQPDVSPGNGNIWKFSDSLYQHYVHSQLISNGTYRLIKMDTYGGAYPEGALVLNSDPYPLCRLSISRDTLTMYVGSIAADGYIAKYVKQ